MKFLKARKPRGVKLSGRRSQDMCTCGLFNCNVGHRFLNTRYIQKLEYRQKNRLCKGCGNKVCSCKSKKTLP